MEIKNIVTIESNNKSTIPLFTIKYDKKLLILHGNTERIKISEFKNGEMQEISSIQLDKNELFPRGIILDDINNDGILELIYGFKPNRINLYKFSKSSFKYLKTYDLSKDNPEILVKKDFSLNVIKTLNNYVFLGSNSDLMIYEIDNNDNFIFFNKLPIQNVWFIDSISISKELNNFYILGLEEKILLLDAKFNTILDIERDDRTYYIDLYDFDDCGYKEIISCCRDGLIYIHKLNFEDNKIKNFTELYSETLIYKKDCGRRKHPSINTFLLKDLEFNGKISLIIGGHDQKIKIYEWNKDEKKFIKRVEDYNQPREEIYSIILIEDNSLNILLLYSTYVEELSLNYLIIYHTIQSNLTKDVLAKIVKDLKDKPEKFCFFLGAGFSYNENNSEKSCPLAKDLINKLKLKYDIENSLQIDYQNSLEYILYHLKKIYPDFNIKNFIKEIFQKELNPSISIKIMGELIKNRIVKHIFSVNFDNLLENETNGVLNTYYRDTDLLPYIISSPFYIKLHGTCKDINSIIASIDEIDLDKTNVPLTIKKDLLKFFYDTTNFIFVGYSFNDIDFKDTFITKLYNQNLDIYIFDPFPNSQMFKVIESRIKLYKNTYHYHIFRCTSSEFFKELKKLLNI